MYKNRHTYKSADTHKAIYKDNMATSTYVYLKTMAYAKQI